MTSFDIVVLSFLNGFAHRSWMFDSWVTLIQADPFFKGGILMILLWWAWFKTSPDQEESRRIVLCTIASGIVALAVARALAVSLPFRARPLHNPLLNVRLAYGMDPNSLATWSSFPSDHATLFFAIVMGLLWISWRLGLIGLLWTIVAICMPRIFLGVHYPSDVLAGAIIGSTIAYAGIHFGASRRIAGTALLWAEAHPGVFYTCLFFFMYQIAQNFDPVRLGGSLAYHSFQIALARLHNAAAPFSPVLHAVR